MSKGIESEKKYYQQAALAYFIYGLIYFAGALYLSRQGLSDRGSMENSGWAWFVAGAVFLVGFPLIIRKGIKWFSLLVATFMMFRVYALVKIAMEDQQVLIPLPWGGEVSRSDGALIFALVAALAMGMLLRAGLLSGSGKIVKQKKSKTH